MDITSRKPRDPVRLLVPGQEFASEEATTDWTQLDKLYWQDSFYLFMGDVMNSAINNVYRHRTSDGQITLAGTLPVQIIGAGVAICR